MAYRENHFKLFILACWTHCSLDIRLPWKEGLRQVLQPFLAPLHRKHPFGGSLPVFFVFTFLSTLSFFVFGWAFPFAAAGFFIALPPFPWFFLLASLAWILAKLSCSKSSRVLPLALCWTFFSYTGEGGAGGTMAEMPLAKGNTSLEPLKDSLLLALLLSERLPMAGGSTTPCPLRIAPACSWKCSHKRVTKSSASLPPPEGWEGGTAACDSFCSLASCWALLSLENFGGQNPIKPTHYPTKNKTNRVSNKFLCGRLQLYSWPSNASGLALPIVESLSWQASPSGKRLQSAESPSVKDHQGKWLSKKLSLASPQGYSAKCSAKYELSHTPDLHMGSCVFSAPHAKPKYQLLLSSRIPSSQQCPIFSCALPRHGSLPTLSTFVPQPSHCQSGICERTCILDQMMSSCQLVVHNLLAQLAHPKLPISLGWFWLASLHLSSFDSTSPTPCWRYWKHFQASFSKSCKACSLAESHQA